MIRTSIKPIALALATVTMAPAAIADINVDLRTFYFNRDFSEGTNESREALTQALRVDYVGQATDSLTLGASLFANVKLADDGDSHLTGLLDSDDNSGYAKLGQIFADYKFTDTLSVKAGRWVVDTPLLNDSDARATPSSTQAIKLTNTYENGQVYVLYSDRASAKTDSSFTKYRDGNGDSYGIALIGGDIALGNGLTLAAAHGHADGYAKQTYLSADMQVNDQVAVGLIHYIGDGEGTNSAFDANMTNLYGSYTMGNLKLSAGYQTVSGDSSYDYTWGGDDDNGLMTTNSVQIMDFNNQDEDSWQLRADYTVAAVPGLSVMARHTDGEYTSGGNEVDEAETNFEMAYAVQGGTLEGLNLRMRVSHVEADAYDDINEVRLIANYSF